MEVTRLAEEYEKEGPHEGRVNLNLQAITITCNTDIKFKKFY